MFGMNTITGKAYFRDAPENTLTVTSRFFTLQGEGPYRGMPAYFVRLAKCNLSCHFCFVPSTKILMGDGTRKKIQDVKVGDLVMSWNGTGFEPKPVTKVYTSQAEKLVKVEVNSASNTWCTPEHPFLVSGRGWIPAGELAPGDVLVNWGTSNYMEMFNPMFDDSNKTPMSEELRKESAERLSALWKNKDFREKNIQRMKNQNPMRDPEVAIKSWITRENQKKSGLEEKFEKICEGLPIKFVGDGSQIIAHKSPDFVVEGQNKLIEIWSDDSLWVKKSPRDTQWMENRRRVFEKAGYEVLFMPLTQKDLRMDNHAKIKQRVAEFIHNGITVKKVTELTGKRAFARLYGTSDAERVVYNLEVQDNHTYVANNLVVHNCDTYFDSGEVQSFDKIFSDANTEIERFFTERGHTVPEWAQPGPDRKIVLVMSGGEPTLQSNLSSFLVQAQDHFFQSQIESNGTVPIDLPRSTTFVVSPKCLEKQLGTEVHAVRYLEPKREMLDRADCLKFVICAPEIEQYAAYSEVPDWAHAWSQNTGKPVFVSPMNMYLREPQRAREMRAEKQLDEITIAERSQIDETISFWEKGLLDMELNQRNHEYTAEYAMKHGFILNLQIHLYASLP